MYLIVLHHNKQNNTFRLCCCLLLHGACVSHKDYLHAQWALWAGILAVLASIECGDESRWNTTSHNMAS